MKLRDHPLMSYRGNSNWPPVWTPRTGAVRRSLRGEIGRLELVYCHPRISERFFLVIEHEGSFYTGSLLFSDPAFAKAIADPNEGSSRTSHRRNRLSRPFVNSLAIVHPRFPSQPANLTHMKLRSDLLQDFVV